MKPRPETLVENRVSWAEVIEHEKICSIFQYTKVGITAPRYRCKCGWVSRPWMTFDNT